MDQKWIHVLMILVFSQKMTSAGNGIVVQEGHKVEIKCQPKEVGTINLWWRLLDTSGVEFIGSFTTNTGYAKKEVTSVFSHSNIHQNHILTLKSFSQSHDSGLYFCASLKSNELKFGDVTRLSGVATVPKPKPTSRSEVSRPRTPAPCVCEDRKKQVEASVSTTFCTPLILGPLAGSCGLLLLLLIIISVHCNKIRTRRCPHHYKKKPRALAPGKQVMANRHV